MRARSGWFLSLPWLLSPLVHCASSAAERGAQSFSAPTHAAPTSAVASTTVAPPLSVRPESEPARGFRCTADAFVRSKGLSSASVFGMIAREPIREAIARARPQLRECYERSSAQGRETAISVRFVIDGEGRVPCAEVVLSDSADASLDQCVSEALVQLRFPASGRGVIVVTYPFRFGGP